MTTSNAGDIEDAVRRLSGISTPHISDAMAKWLSRKLKHQTLDPGIKPICRGLKVCGPAYTVRCYPGATYAMEKAIAEAPAGCVIVCDGQGSHAGVMMGELMSTFAHRRGIAGAVIDGAVRDIEEVIELGFALFARHVTPRCGTFDKLGDVGQTICCGGVVVRPGDVVAGDDNGVVIVPQDIAPQVAAAAEELHQWETAVKQCILEGQTLEQAAKSCPPPKVRQIP